MEQHHVLHAACVPSMSPHGSLPEMHVVIESRMALVGRDLKGSRASPTAVGGSLRDLGLPIGQQGDCSPLRASG